MFFLYINKLKLLKIVVTFIMTDLRENFTKESTHKSIDEF